MTQEEKARAYDEALKWMRELYPGLHGATKEDAEHYFPELKESEDERIRKELLEVIRHCYEDGGYALCTDDYKKYSAYLEKKKEQKPTVSREEILHQLFQNGSITLSDYLYLTEEQKPAEPSSSNNESEYDRGYRDGKAFQLKQVEQYSIGKTFMGLIPCWVNAPSTLQPAHKYHGKNAVIMHENNGGFMCCFIDDEEATVAHLPENTGFVEGWRKKPAGWSKEDGAMIKSILFVLESYVSQSESASSPSLITTYPTYYKEIDWLKSLRPQSKQEWSEEDEQRIAEIEFAVMQMNTKRVDTKDKCLAWLKSLRSRKNSPIIVDADQLLKILPPPSWKPSEEQMKALHAASSVSSLGEYVQRHLFSLYKDLKKLIAKR